MSYHRILKLTIRRFEICSMKYSKMGLIRKEYDESNKIFGSPKITKRLVKQGHVVSERTVTRYMKEMGIGIRSITKKKYKPTSNSKHSLPVFENLLQRDFHAEKPNEKWVTDITYIPNDEGWLYWRVSWIYIPEKW